MNHNHITALTDSPLGKSTDYPSYYDPAWLCPIPRQQARALIPRLSEGNLPFVGADQWTAYEISWLNPKGKPCIGLAHITVPCESSHLFESKSLKLYLASFNQHIMPDAEAVRECLIQDLSRVCWLDAQTQGRVGVQLKQPHQFEQERIATMQGVLLDRLDLEITPTLWQMDLSEAAALYLQTDTHQPPIEETLITHLFRSLCPVTAQPDWASVSIHYRGYGMDQEGLLRYLLAYRQHGAFHESCVEQLFTDIWHHTRPTRLMVSARFTRRGGIDINPWRSSHPTMPPSFYRTARQ